MKTIIIDGRLGKDAEVKTTARGTKYVRFSLANDQFTNGENVTEWFDVFSFDSFIIEKKIEALKKGRYVIVTGTPRFDVNAKNGQIYKNMSVNAAIVETPSLGGGKREQEGQDSTSMNEGVSVYSSPQQQRPAQQYVQPQQQMPQQQMAQQQMPQQQQVSQPQQVQMPSAYSQTRPVMQETVYQQPQQQYQQAAQPQPQPQYQQPAPQAGYSEASMGDDDELPF